MSLITNPDTKIIDASTAHRTAKGWTYGLPELSPLYKEAIKNSREYLIRAAMLPHLRCQYIRWYIKMLCRRIILYHAIVLQATAAAEKL